MTYRDDFRQAGPFTATLAFYLTGDDPLDANEALQRLALKFPFDNDGDNQALKQMATHLPGCAWVRQLKVQDYPIHFLLYSVQGDFVQPFIPWMNKQRAQLLPEAAIERLQGSRHWFVLETLLSPENPQAAYGFMHRIAGLVAGDRLVASFDVQAKRLRTREEVYDMTSCEAPPPLSELYSLNFLPGVFAAGGEEPAADALMTSGLARAMIPELVVLSVDDGAEIAGEICNTLASFFVLYGVPEDEAPVQLHRTAPALEFQRLSKFTLGEELLNSMGGGEKEAANIAPLAYGGLPLGLHWVVLPQRDTKSHALIGTGEATEATRRLLAEANASGLMQLTPLESQLLGARARDRWWMLQQIWELAEDGTTTAERFGPRPFFSYKVGYEVEVPGEANEAADAAEKPEEEFDLKQLAGGGDQEGETEAEARKPREYLWFELVDVAGQGVQGRLLNAPVALNDLQLDDLAWHKLSEVADWVIGLPPEYPDQMLAGNRLGPGDMLALRHLVRQVESPRS